VTAPGHRDLTTHIFVAGSEYIESDTVFAVKKSLVADFEEVTGESLAEKWQVKAPFRHADFDVVMQPGA
jgi:protocatechuate 3,4-dioxygenase beta subunit